MDDEANGKIESSKPAIWTRLFAKELDNEKDIDALEGESMDDKVADGKLNLATWKVVGFGIISSYYNGIRRGGEEPSNRKNIDAMDYDNSAGVQNPLPTPSVDNENDLSDEVARLQKDDEVGVISDCSM